MEIKTIKMKQKYLVPIIICLILVLLILIWAPWINQEGAREKAIDDFNNQYEGVIDGCGLDCEGCGVNSVNRQIFGYKVSLSYKCGLKDYTQEGSRFVSVFGTVSKG